MIEIVEKTKETETVQVQIKSNKGHSRSFTIRGLGVDYIFGLFFTIIEKLTQTDSNKVQITCYKPPREEDEK